MTSPRGPILVGVSGVDGSGKSSLVASLIARPDLFALRPMTLYLYGCVICRRWPSRPALTASRQARRGATDAILARVRDLHAHVDAGEMTIRLLAGIFGARSTGSRLVITDRSPLDGLVKHDPSPRSLVARWYLRLASRYRMLLWLDGDPAALAERDPEHRAEDLAAAQGRFRAWATRLPNVVRIQTTPASIPEVSELAMAAVALAAPTLQPGDAVQL